MSKERTKRIGILVGQEREWPDSFLETVVKQSTAVEADLVRLGGTFLETAVSYDVIVDRMSHAIPYYRAYLQDAVIRGCYVINNPFSWSADNRFLGMVMAHRLKLPTPRTVALPNKEVEEEIGPDSFRNLEYPMDWQGIIDYVGVPAIFKDLRSGGRRQVLRVHSVDELIRCYDESGHQTMILQQIIESDIHIHAFVIGREEVLLLQYDLESDRYRPGILSAKTDRNQQITKAARALTNAYGYDINMVEFVVQGDTPYVINSTNPAPVIDTSLMTGAQLEWLVTKTADLAIARALNPLPQPGISYVAHPPD